MGARKYDVVKPNYEALKEDMNRFGITALQLADRLGKSRTYINSMFRKDLADRSTIEAVERCMFREHGTYYTEVEGPVETPTAPQAVVSEGMGIVLKQILAAVNALSEKDGTAELVEAVKANEAVLQEVLQKQKELTTLAARILSNMERRANV